jgi:hypothetical protein
MIIHGLPEAEPSRVAQFGGRVSNLIRDKKEEKIYIQWSDTDAVLQFSVVDKLVKAGQVEAAMYVSLLHTPLVVQSSFSEYAAVYLLRMLEPAPYRHNICIQAVLSYRLKVSWDGVG